MLIFAVLFVLTRVPLAWVALNPPLYEQDGINPVSDVDLYQSWATALIDEGQAVYSQTQIEYPPGSLPFILIPGIVQGDRYLTSFVVMTFLIDVAAVFGLYQIAKRWGSWWGIALWVIAIPALGPTVYMRLDLIPAVATIWAFERASANDWLGSGGWFGVGAIAKLYPLLFLPAGAILAAERRRFIAASVIVFCAPILPLLPSLEGVITSVLGYHMDRGIQIESLWGGILFLAQKSGSELTLGYAFKALHFAGPLADTLEKVATFASFAALALGTFIATRARDRDRPKAFAEVHFVILALSLAAGSVFSPQFVIWLIAGAGVVGCMTDSKLRGLVIVVIPIAVLTQAIFPFFYVELLGSETLPLTMLWIRNSLVAILGLAAAAILLVTYRRKSVSAPSTPEPASG